ncbi:hypothetical protein P7C70_g6847, partial [Phenoliferia sp. Uapishka_3]
MSVLAGRFESVPWKELLTNEALPLLRGDFFENRSRHGTKARGVDQRTGLTSTIPSVGLLFLRLCPVTSQVITMSEDRNTQPRGSQSSSNPSGTPTGTPGPHPFRRTTLGNANGSPAPASPSDAKWNKFIQDLTTKNFIVSQSNEERQLTRLNKISSPEQAAVVLSAVYFLQQQLDNTHRLAKKTHSKVTELEVREDPNTGDKLDLNPTQNKLLKETARAYVWSGFVQEYCGIGLEQLEDIMRSQNWADFWKSTIKKCPSFKILISSHIKRMVRIQRTALTQKRSVTQIRDYLEENPNPTQNSIRTFFNPDVLKASNYLLAKGVEETQPYFRLTFLIAQVQLQDADVGGFNWATVDAALAERYKIIRSRARIAANVESGQVIPKGHMHQQTIYLDKVDFTALPVDADDLDTGSPPPGQGRRSSPAANSPPPLASGSSALKRTQADMGSGEEEDDEEIGLEKKKKKKQAEKKGKGKKVKPKSRHGVPQSDEADEDSDDFALET